MLPLILLVTKIKDSKIFEDEAEAATRYHVFTITVAI